MKTEEELKKRIEKLFEKYHKPLGVFEIENLKQELLRVLDGKITLKGGKIV